MKKDEVIYVNVGKHKCCSTKEPKEILKGCLNSIYSEFGLLSNFCFHSLSSDTMLRKYYNLSTVIFLFKFLADINDNAVMIQRYKKYAETRFPDRMPKCERTEFEFTHNIYIWKINDPMSSRVIE